MSSTHVCFVDVLTSKDIMEKEANRQSSATKAGTLNQDMSSDDGDAIQQCDSDGESDLQQRPGGSPKSISPIPVRYERNMGFFRQLSRRFGLRSNDDLNYCSSGNDDDNQSSSTDSCSSTHANTSTANTVTNTNNENSNNNNHNGNGINNNNSNNNNGNNNNNNTDNINYKDARINQDPNDVLLSMTVIGETHISNTSSETSSTVDEIDGTTTTTTGGPPADTVATKRCNVTRASFSRLQRRSTSTIRRAFQSFSLTTRSLSCSGSTPPPEMGRDCNSSSIQGTPIKSQLRFSSNTDLHSKRVTSAQASFTNISTHSQSTTSLASSVTMNGQGNGQQGNGSKSIKTKITSKPPPQRILRQPVSYTYLRGISGLPTQRVPRNSVCCQYARR